MHKAARLISSANNLPPIHIQLVGCNGVPGRVYQPLLQRLENLGVHSTSFTEVHNIPHVEDWSACIDKVVTDTIAERAAHPGVRVVGFGHSLGGALCYAASTKAHPTCNETGVFDGVLLFDPPMFALSTRLAILAAQLTGLINQWPLVKGARRKPKHFPGGRAEAEAFVTSRRLYKSFHPEILETFLSRGIETNDAGVASFAFTPEQEAEFYATTPADLFAATAVGQYDASNCPGTLFYSTRHAFLQARDVRFLGSAKGVRGPGSDEFGLVGLDLPHFHPLIDPDNTAELIFSHARRLVEMHDFAC